MTSLDTVRALVEVMESGYTPEKTPVICLDDIK